MTGDGLNTVEYSSGRRMDHDDQDKQRGHNGREGHDGHDGGRVLDLPESLLRKMMMKSRMRLRPALPKAVEEDIR